ncbi:MAG TPA: flagellar biosynthetic protein FliO [Cellvibrio sp.]|nr:flagellar biosynthetic protein FliO [Cellvibrio sp.]
MKITSGNDGHKTSGFYFMLLLCCFAGVFFSSAPRADNEVQSAAEVNTALVAAAQSPVAAPVTTPGKPALTPAPKLSTSSQLANLMGGLLLILGLIYGLSWFVKRFSQGGFMQNSTIKMLSSMPLGTRERLLLVDVGGTQILLGVTAAQINTLHVFAEPVLTAEKNTAVSGSTASSDFSQKLMAILQQKTSGNTQPPEHKNIKE